MIVLCDNCDEYHACHNHYCEIVYELAMANLRYLRNDYFRFSSLCSIKKRSFDFFVFPLHHNHWRRHSFHFDLVQFKKVSLRSVSFLQIFGIHQFVLPSYFETGWLGPFASTHSSKILEQPGRFCFVVDKVRTLFRFVSSWRNWRLSQLDFASIFAILLFLFLSLSWTVLLSQFVFASILKGCMLVLFVSLRYLTFPRIDLDK
jgi:hypothetical protein